MIDNSNLVTEQINLYKYERLLLLLLLLFYSYQNKEIPTFKDNDFTRDNVKLIIGQEKKSDLLEKIRKDIEVSFATSLCFVSVMMMMIIIIVIIIVINLFNVGSSHSYIDT